MFQILNSIPVVGHLKAAIHYITNDVEAGNEAMYDASRSTLVTVGGICGSFAGPVGMGVGAVLAGALTDLVVSDFSGKSNGLIKDLDNMFDEDGNPIEGVLKLTMTVGLDAVTGGVTGKICRSAIKGVVKIGGTATLDMISAEVTNQIRKSKKTKARPHAPMKTPMNKCIRPSRITQPPNQTTGKRVIGTMKMRDSHTGQIIEIPLHDGDRIF